MTENSGSGETLPAFRQVPLADLAARFTLAVLLGVSGWTFTQLWNHEGRLVAIETSGKDMVDDLKEIKADVKKLLAGNHSD